MPDPAGKAEVRTVFRSQLDKLTATADNNGKVLTDPPTQRCWTQVEPFDWIGTLGRYDKGGGFYTVFDRSENIEDYRTAIKDGSKSGTVGDTIASQLQGEYLACQQRAFMSRHMSQVRSITYATARRAGHGADGGVLKRGVLRYIENILRAGKDS